MARRQSFVIEQNRCRDERSRETAATRFVGSGSTVLFSSHVMELVEQVCDHVSIIDKGRIVVTGTVDEVRGRKTLQQAFIDRVGSRATDREVLSWLGSSSS